MSSNYEIQYPYALDSNKKEIHISSVPDELKERDEYHCIGCGELLIARKPRKHEDKPKPHFAHKSVEEGSKCSKETYLHNLAKMTFKEVFNQCIEQDQKLEIIYEVEEKCKFFDVCEIRKKYRFKMCKSNAIKSIDLTKYYSRANIEWKVDNYRADVLLVKRKKSYPEFLVEIFVTHAVDQQKIESGHRILEIKIETEEDVELIKQRKFQENSKTKFYNFTFNDEELVIDESVCKRWFDWFIVYRSGKYKLIKQTPLDFYKENLENLGSNIIHWITTDYSKDVANKVYNHVIESHLNGVNIKSCIVCRNKHTKNTDIKCMKSINRKTKSTFAAECKQYDPL